MSLQWVRLDANINQNDKVRLLIKQRDGWRAFGVYIFALGWSGGHGRDGDIPRHMLEDFKGTEKHARMLVDHGFWEYTETGWRIKNWDTRQELSIITDAKRMAQQKGAAKTNCQRWHGKDCECWRDWVPTE